MILSLGLLRNSMGMGNLRPGSCDELVCKSDAPADHIQRSAISLLQKSSIVSNSSSKIDPWSHNAESPVWQLLQQELLSDIGRERLYHNTQSVVPTTLVYLLSQYDQLILKLLRNDIQQEKNDGILNIHLIGATYLFEGLSDWKLLAEWVPSYIRTVRIDLILGSPFQEDGPSRDEKGRKIVTQVADDMQGQVNVEDVSFLNIASQRRRKIKKKAQTKMEAQDLRRKSCGSHYFATTGVRVVVKCHEKLYQDVWDIIPKPNLAMMINPGFPLPNRRAFDGVLQRLLEKKIPTAVSAQQDAHGEKDRNAHLVALENRSTSAVTLHLKKNFDDEAYQVLETLQMYEAQVATTSSPFPYVYTDDDHTLVKNSVLAFFVGRKPGATPIKMLRPMSEGRRPEHEKADEQMIAELTASLRTPVSRPYARAMRAWARSSMSSCTKAKTVQDWIVCCHAKDDAGEIEC